MIWLRTCDTEERTHVQEITRGGHLRGVGQHRGVGIKREDKVTGRGVGGSRIFCFFSTYVQTHMTTLTPDDYHTVPGKRGISSNLCRR